MDSYSEEYLDSLYQNEEFLSEYNEFKKDNVKINEFKKFIDGIELNTNISDLLFIRSVKIVDTKIRILVQTLSQSRKSIVFSIN